MLNFGLKQPSPALAATVDVQSLTDVSPNYAAHIARFEELEARRRRAIVELRKVATTGSANEGALKPAAKPASPDERSAKIYALAFGADAPLPTRSLPSTAEQYRQLYNEIDEIGDALDLLQMRIRDLHKETSRLICQQVRDQHRQLVRKTASALRDLHEANLHYWALGTELDHQSVSWGGCAW